LRIAFDILATVALRRLLAPVALARRGPGLFRPGFSTAARRLGGAPIGLRIPSLLDGRLEGRFALARRRRRRGSEPGLLVGFVPRSCSRFTSSVMVCSIELSDHHERHGAIAVPRVRSQRSSGAASAVYRLLGIPGRR
jgi:hypothetical protein